MKKILQLALLFLAAFGLLRSAGAETRLLEMRPIDARVVRVKLDGVMELRIRQGNVPSLSITADKRYIADVSTAQSGDTLHIETEIRGFKINPSSVRAELVLPNLRELSSEGMGTTDITGFTGDEIVLSLEGAGSIKMVGEYRKLKASLGGVGSMQLWVGNSERADLDLEGAGSVVLGGRGKLLKASLGGLGSLNAQQFQAESVNLDLSGLGNATVNASASAKLNLSGLGSVVVYGKPANRDASVDGLGKVSWK
ncbi:MULTISPECIES: GIN domain-containing protein [unclassified Janthinobacterium]|uniref:GIN domain-containing protein n=1 Tax=unclassified Janthinobacterium TaxID=2610881 RepID=UPI0016102989|nr:MULTISPECIES: DUF2807 domain-containing protein [unclassified Janthinobacterium]MBB5367038.1 hypothetical protein [Janthinobacterium sp. K2C7]MBB5380484.1 hypothetical protein [Janthinobacterium sp. K2Li3]MBB5385420.1 hypothetical protein [Janthinobacterium sp. K2E3]